MKTVALRDAKTNLSAIVQAAQEGEPTILSKHGEPAAMVVPIADGRKLYQENKPSFAELLMSIPGEIPYERDQTPLRVTEFD
jgi:antitoxin Phd